MHNKSGGYILTRAMLLATAELLTLLNSDTDVFSRLCITRISPLVRLAGKLATIALVNLSRSFSLMSAERIEDYRIQ